MSITSRKIGALVHCPTCDAEVLVPDKDVFDVPRPQGMSAADDATAPDSPAVGPAHRPLERPHDRLWDSPRGTSEGLETPAVPPPSAVPRTPPVVSPTWGAAVPGASSTPERMPSPATGHHSAGPETDHSDADDNGWLKTNKSNAITDEMDLTPMVDVVFQLLIFFMVTASFSLEKTLSAPTPDQEQRGAAPSPQLLEELEDVSIVVRISDQNDVTIDDEPVGDVANLAAALQTRMREQQKSELIVSPSPAALHRTVVAVIDAANEVGMQRIRMTSRAAP
jgi:biopolymer transport protein ExbD